MFLVVTGQYRRRRAHIGRAAACALALGVACGAPLAQSPLKETPARWQFPPTLTPPAKGTALLPLRASESEIEKVWLDADALFDFDANELRPQGRAALDDFVARLKGATLGTMKTVGHADRLEEYQQILSEDRAVAVKAYLVSKGIKPDRVHAEGRGATQPVTKPGECASGKNAKVIACLQSDRRVGIEVAGTRALTNWMAGGQ